MGHRCCSKQKVKRGLWSPEEDEKLVKYITANGHASWSSVPKLAGLQRCGKSCRLRWINYLRPDLRRGSFTAQEEQIIIDVHRILGNRWAQIAKHLPGRTDNEVKNFWNSCIKKKLISQGLDPRTHNLIPAHKRASTTAATTSKLSPSNNASQFHQQPFSVINMNSHAKDAPMEIISPSPILTMPPSSNNTGHHQYHPPLLQTMSASLATPGYHQNPNNLAWNTISGTLQNLPDTTIFPYISSMENTPMSSTSSSSCVNPSGFGVGLLDESYFWGNNAIVDPVEAQRFNCLQPQQELENLQAKEKICVPQMYEANKGVPQGMDASFESSSFTDLEFVESTLLLSNSMCRDLSSMDDFAWDF